MSSAEQEMLDQFMAITGSTDAAAATNYLEMSGNNLDMAIGLYMEHGGGGGATAAAAPAPSSEAMTSHPPLQSAAASMEYADAALAASLAAAEREQQQQQQQSNSGSGAEDDGVRAPDQTRTMRLMDDHGGMGMGMMGHPGASMAWMGGAGGAGPDNLMAAALADPSIRLMQEMMDEQFLQQQQQRPSAFAASSPQRTSQTNRRRRRARSAREAVDLAAGAGAESKRDDDDDDDDADADENNNNDQNISNPSRRDRSTNRGLQMNDDDDEEDAEGYQYDDEDDEDDDVQMMDAQEEEEDEDGHAAGTGTAPSQPRLSDMFAAPHHLLHTAGGFQGARQMAKDSKRWLLVNVQRDSEFSSHALNRDVWRNDLVENLIREGFIFWQQDDSSIEGGQFVQRYKVQGFPHISMIDPRTGRLLWKKEGWTQENPMTAERFAEYAMDFCSRNTFDRPPTAAAPPGAATTARGATPSSTATTMTTPSMNNTTTTPNQMTEEEQVMAAVKASMEDQQQQQPSSSLDDAEEVQFLGNSAAEAVVAAAAPSSSSSWVQPFLDYAVPTEDQDRSSNTNPSSSTMARISFRMPNGSRVVRAFAGSHPVRIMYAFVAQSLQDEFVNDNNKKFTLMAGFPPRDLASNMDLTIQECSLHGEAVTVRWATTT